MVRTLTANNSSKVNQNLGTEPIVVLKAEWGSGTVYYADKTITIGAINCVGAILECADISSREKAENVSEVSNMSVKLDDSTGALKALIKTQQIEGVAVTIYHHYVGNGSADLLTVLKGRVISPVVWNEGDASLTFEVETYIDNKEVGYAPDTGDFEDLANDAVDVPWPLSFGTTVKVPAVQVKKQAKGNLRYGINEGFTEFSVEGGKEFFPQNEAIYIRVGKIRFSGSFASDVFTVTGANLAYHTNLALANRPAAVDDPYYDDPTVFWLSGTEKIAGLYCLINHATYGWMVNRCTHQIGKRCHFVKPWRPSNTPLGLKLDATSTISETAGCPRNGWGANYTMEANPIYVDNSWDRFFDPYVIASIMINGVFLLASGVDVRLEKDFSDLYVFNLIPSNEVLDVFGHRTYKGEKIFAPIPSSYYTKYTSLSLGDQTCSALEFPVSLKDKLGEEWEGDVYVSSRSSEGPNAADIIKYLIETYSNLTVDSTTFNAVRQKVAPFWANFTVFDQPDVLKLCEEIAWQSRCALTIQSGTVKIKYLSEVPTADVALTEDETELKTLELGFTDTEDIQTKLIAKWFKGYSQEERELYPKSRQIVYKNNISTFGLKELEKDFTIYNVEEFVKLSAYFWGYRYSNCWRTATLRSFLKSLKLESFDCISHDIDALSTNSIRGEVRTVNHDVNENSIQTDSVLGSKAGDSDAGEPIEDQGFWLGDPNYPVTTTINPIDPGSGLHEVDYVVPVYGSTGYGSGGDEPDGDNGGDDPTYYLVFTTKPTVVQRGVNFTLTVEVQDYNGDKVSIDTTATLAFTSSDGSDAIDTTNINIVNGSWSGTVQITGGSGSDSGIIVVASTSDYSSGSTSAFVIVDALTNTLSWYTEPASVTRDADFSVAISGGPAGGTLAIQLASSDSSDRLYIGGSLATTITFDGSGEYAASNWQIRGGQESDVGSLTLHDTNLVYADKQSSQFPIVGISERMAAHTLRFTQVCTAIDRELDISISTDILDEEVFSMTVTLKKLNGDTDTDFTGGVSISVEDDNGNLQQWLDAGPGANCYGPFIVATLIDGVWSSTSCKLHLSTAVSPITFSGLCLDNSDWTGSLTKAIGASYLAVSFDASVTRDNAFNLVIQAKDADDNDITDYVPSTTVAIALTSDDGSDAILPVSTDNSGWSSGSKTVSCTISGGSGSDSIRIDCTDSSNGMTGYDTGTVVSAFASWSGGGTLAAAISKLVYADKFYAKCSNDHVYRYDGGTTWTDLGSAPGDICAFGGELYRARVTGGNIYAYKWNGSTWGTEYSLFAAGLSAGLTVGSDGNLYLSDFYFATVEKTARKSGGTWTTLGTGPGYSDGAVAYQPSNAEIFDGAVRYADTYVAGTTVAASPTFVATNVVVGTRLYAANGASGFLYVTSKDGATSVLALPTGYNLADSVYSAGGKLYALLRKTSDSSWHIMSYDGSDWTNEQDVTYASGSKYAKSSTVLMVVINTTVLVKG